MSFSVDKGRLYTPHFDMSFSVDKGRLYTSFWYVIYLISVDNLVLIGEVFWYVI